MSNKDPTESKSRTQANISEPNVGPRIHINKEYESLVPRMTKDAFVSLKRSIRKGVSLSL